MSEAETTTARTNRATATLTNATTNMNATIEISPKTNAIAQAVQKAKNYFKETFEHYELWESSSDEVTIRAWDNTENADYAFFTVAF